MKKLSKYQTSWTIER